jgi:hypothetical protein
VKDGAHDKISVRRNPGRVGGLAMLTLYHVYSLRVTASHCALS